MSFSRPKIFQLELLRMDLFWNHFSQIKRLVDFLFFHHVDSFNVSFSQRRENGPF